ncbi:MAG: Ig-like domain-containing protein [Ferruginibacter sp.]
MRSAHILFTLFIVSCLYILAIANTGCAQIGSPTGGPRDSIAPRLLSASPKLSSTNVTGNKITLTFNEYVEIKEAQTNVVISPFPKKTPSVDYKLKTVTVKLKDSLLPNTTYSINFGNAIVDINEGNPLKDFIYVFSTGNQIDSLELTGKIVMAETGRADSTLIAMLYRSPDDSAVQKTKPDYVTKLSSDGSFSFVNLPPGNFKVYALKDGDGGKTYNSKKEIFAFADAAVTVSEKTAPVILYASALEKESRIVATAKSIPNKKLTYKVAPGVQTQDLKNPFELSFNNPLKDFDPAKLILRDTNYNPVPSAAWTIDSTRTKIRLTTNWQEGMQYRLIMDTTAVSDSLNHHIAKSDTIRFTTKQSSDYGNVVLRFSNLDLSKHPVLQLVVGEEVRSSYPLTQMEWSNKFVPPGEYDIRILFDDNNNGKWDPGDYSKKRQPEKAITLTEKLAVRANWDNERDIKL